MQGGKQLTAIIVSAALLMVFAGCNESARRPVGPTTTPPPIAESESPEMANRFQQASPQGRTAVDSAIELSRQHAKLAQEMIQAIEEKQTLETQNAQLTTQLTDLETKLAQSQKELNEANALLVEMSAELNTWKEDVLGFRTEMRDAERAQLEALVKILTLLGGEVRAQSALGEDTGPLSMGQ